MVQTIDSEGSYKSLAYGKVVRSMDKRVFVDIPQKANKTNLQTVRIILSFCQNSYR